MRFDPSRAPPAGASASQSTHVTRTGARARNSGRSPVVALVASFAVLGCAVDAPRNDRPNLVLIVVDTLRADALTPYGAPDTASPNIDRLARSGATFDNAVAVSPWTGPSVSSMVTGRYPNELGIHDLRTPLPPNATTLAIHLGRAGYTTGAVVSNDIAGPSYGHAVGYDFFHFESYKGERSDGPRLPAFRADGVTGVAVAWIEDRGPSLFFGPAPPFFLHVHYTDPHEPYLPPAVFRDAALEGLERLDDRYLLEKTFVSSPPTQGQLASLEASYRGEVAFVDAQIGRLLASLPENTAVVLASDHGEEFWDHGGFLHGHSLYEELLRVAMIVRGPGVPPGVRVASTVSHVDIAPTLLDFAGIEPSGAAAMSGRSLLALARGEVADEPTVFSAVATERGEWLTARSGAFKLHVLPRTARVQLFDVERDPREHRDLSGQRPAVTRKLREALVDWQGRGSARTTGADPKRLEALRAIGYIE